MRERDGPVLRVERARGQVSAADQWQHLGAQLEAGRDQVSGPVEADRRRLVELVGLGRVYAKLQRQRVHRPVLVLEQDVHEPRAQVRRSRLPRTYDTGASRATSLRAKRTIIIIIDTDGSYNNILL